MKPTFIKLATMLAVITILGVACSTDDKKDNIGGLYYGGSNYSDGSISKNVVVGSYTYSSYNSIKRELEIDFDSDFTGQGYETSYGSSGNFLSAYKYVFEWSIEKGKVLLRGVYATVDSDGNVGTSITWSAEFELKQGVFVPGRGFIEGYAETALKEQKSKDIEKYIESEIKFDVDNSRFTINVKSNLKDKWSGYTVRYGIRLYSTGTDSWLKTSNDETVSFSFVDSYVDVYVQSLNGLYSRRSSLSNEEKNLRDGLKGEINDYIKSLKQDKIFKVVVSVGDDVFTIKSTYIILNSVLLSDWSSGNSGGNNNNGSAKTGTLNGHEWVNLGLSVKWATCNIGASSQDDYGDYYAWGEIHTKTSYTWNNCRFRSKGDTNDNVEFSKYNGKKQLILEMSDDVASSKWGGSWRMPTDEEFEELIDNCTWIYTTMNGINGYKVTSSKFGYTDCSIFLPAAGSREGTKGIGVGSFGHYWSSTVAWTIPAFGEALNFGPTFYKSTVDFRRYGQSVRPVCP